MKTPDPTTPRGKPPRAQPLQPDRPMGGNGQLPADAGSMQSSGQEQQEQFRRSARQLKKQVETGVDNMREGYD